jgi:hypothetical protein
MCLHYRGLCCSWRCLHYRGLSCIWTCLHYRGVYVLLLEVSATRPELNLDVSALQRYVSNPQGPMQWVHTYCRTCSLRFVNKFFYYRTCSLCFENNFLSS